MDITLIDGKLSINGVDEVLLKSFYRKFRIDLLDGNIVHYRPIAFKLGGSWSSKCVSNTSKIPGLGYSACDIGFILSNIVTCEKRGIMPNELQASASMSVLSSDCSYIKLSGKDINISEEGSIFYIGEGISELPKLLSKNDKIFSNLREDLDCNIILLRGKGFRDFDDNMKLIWETEYKPIRSEYNLNEFFSIQEYIGGNYIKLNYKKEIDEYVLYNILKDYIEEECFKDVIR